MKHKRKALLVVLLSMGLLLVACGRKNDSQLNAGMQVAPNSQETSEKLTEQESVTETEITTEVETATETTTEVETATETTTETEKITESEITSEVETTTELESATDVERGTESEATTESEPATDISSEPTESEQPSQSETTPESEQPSEKEEPTEQEPVYVVKDMDKTMYATSSVNVRSGPASDYKKLGSLSKGQQVKVNGAVEGTSWYRIDYNGKEGYVSSKYLQDTPVKEEATTNSRQTLMNSVTLKPYSCGIVEIDQMVDDVFVEIFTDGMSTYDKVKACYDYIIKKTEYGQNGFVQQFINDNGIIAYYYYTDAVHTYGLLTTGIGVCDDYSSTFAVMLRRIGLECYATYGQYVNNSGKSSGHVWCEVNLNGETYIFDPQIEDKVASNGKIKYSYFFKTYSERPGNYVKAEES